MPHTTMLDSNFMILSKTGNPGLDNGYKPITYADGTLVIYGCRTDALADCAPDEIVVRSLFPEGHTGSSDNKGFKSVTERHVEIQKAADMLQNCIDCGCLGDGDEKAAALLISLARDIIR